MPAAALSRLARLAAQPRCERASSAGGLASLKELYIGYFNSYSGGIPCPRLLPPRRTSVRSVAPVSAPLELPISSPALVPAPLELDGVFLAQDFCVVRFIL
jgi:hypothetical protein